MATRTYRLARDEEEISGLSFLACKPVAAMSSVPAQSRPGDPNPMFAVSADELAAAFQADPPAALDAHPRCK